mmetsp:Transcript_23623/g.74234  ORF Transcript_23623/g.74234 Transcript_23623/m.74234 type:complete len:90 (+) Transcript_23623:423-692(+)
MMYGGLDEPGLAAEVKCPQLLMPAGGDADHYRDGTLTDIINANGFEGAAVDFPDMRHGWTIRGDATDPAVNRDVYAAMSAAKDFFIKHV